MQCLSDVDCSASQHCVGRVCQSYTACTNSLGCTTAKGPDGNDQPICDQSICECTACLTEADCPASHDCLDKACTPYLACQNSVDCGTDEVCDKATNRCVQCLGNNDCSATQQCEQGQCRDFVPCSSDKQCTDKGLLCDQAKGKCAQCLDNSDCPDIYHCQESGVDQTGLCVLDVCAQGQGTCSGNAKVTCNAVGDGFTSPVACPAQTTCSAPGGKPECQPWLCQPGVSCDGNQRVQCSDDGLTILATTDCTASGGACYEGKCAPVVCEHNVTFCDGNQLMDCTANGTVLLYGPKCGTLTYCLKGKCVPQVCVPNQAKCIGNAVQTCNAQGLGYLEPLTDCNAIGKVCSAGACVSLVCDPQNPLYCEGNVVKQCDPTGLFPVSLQTCGAGFYCASGACSPQICTPGAATCSGNQPATCNADGSGYLAVQASCGAGTACSDGTCLPYVCGDQVCEPYEKALCAADCQCTGEADGVSCDDANACTANDQCSTGACVGTALDCDDGYALSTDSCVALLGCQHLWPETCDGLDNDADGVTDNVVCGSGACSCGPGGVATCPADCTVCPDDGDLAMLIDDGGTKKVVCAHDYSAWGVVADAPNTFTNNGDDTVSDSKSGLMWQLTVSANSYTWADAKLYCDGLTLASKQDWRLPTQFELESLVDFAKTSAPTIAVPFVSDTPTAYFWSATSIQGGSSFAWNVNFNGGSSYYNGVADNNSVRCVRRADLGFNVTSPANGRYVVNASAKTVLDKTTGLTWQREPPVTRGSSGETTGRFNWADAKQYCANLELGGHTDWRLPGIAELRTLVRRKTTGTVIDNLAFPNTPVSGIGVYSSATSFQGGSSDAWVVSFGNGSSNGNALVTFNYRVR